MAKRFGAKLTDAQWNNARALERAGITTISQAVKAYEREDREQINLWIAEYKAQKTKEQGS